MPEPLTPSGNTVPDDGYLLDEWAAALMARWGVDDTDQDAYDAACADLRVVLPLIADWLIARGEAAQRSYDQANHIHAMSPVTCNRLTEARHFAEALREVTTE